jgi:O-antigen ligase
MWEDLLSFVKNPIIGYGYESFWLGERREYMWENWKIASQAHNGYLEMYLNMGVIGLCFILAWIVSGLMKVRRAMERDYKSAVLRLCLIVVVAVYNWTEATFFGSSNMWLLFFLGIMDVPERLEKRRNVGYRTAFNES